MVTSRTTTQRLNAALQGQRRSALVGLTEGRGPLSTMVHTLPPAGVEGFCLFPEACKTHPEGPVKLLLGNPCMWF